MGCCVSKKRHQVTCHELRRLQKESQQQKIKERYFTNAKMESITARNRKFDSDVENTALKKKIQDVSAVSG